MIVVLKPDTAITVPYWRFNIQIDISGKRARFAAGEIEHVQMRRVIWMSLVVEPDVGELLAIC